MHQSKSKQSEPNCSSCKWRLHADAYMKCLICCKASAFASYTPIINKEKRNIWK